ncbi:MAG: DNA-processing protein DprA [Rikenellaceae bacterium]|nr:DNA-processing protein DprA [Rikenellaceae bacterium]
MLGNPLGFVYPEAHTADAQIILDRGGAVVSEFHSRCEMQGNNFLRRNRIIAGLSSGTLVVESAYRGGSLSTAACALGYFRDVMAVPGRIGDSMSEGTNLLIRDNRAAMVLSPTDILSCLNWDLLPVKNKSKGLPEEPQPQPALRLDSQQQRILETLNDCGNLSIDDLADKTGLPASKISALCLGMEIGGLVRRTPGNMLEKL